MRIPQSPTRSAISLPPTALRPSRYRFSYGCRSAFAFLIPCPPALAKDRREICTDAQGFDRVALHKQLNADVLFRTGLVNP